MKILFIFLFSLTSFAQIGSKVQSAKPGITGNWVNKEFGYEMKLQLNENGKGVFDDETISYSIVGTKLSIKFEEETISYGYKLNGSVLTLSGGDLDAPINFGKQGGSISSSSLPTKNTSTANKTLENCSHKLI